MNTTRRFRVLFLCTGNSARSIFAEFLLRKIAPSKFEVFSAGSHPRSAPHPLALGVLNEVYKIDTATARSKSWDEFEDSTFDFVITLCDNINEICPELRAQPILAHWSSPDPVRPEATAEEQSRVFFQVAQEINRRLELFASLPFDKLDALRLSQAAKEIGEPEIPACR